MKNYYRFIKENYSSKTLIVVDVQPEYEKGFSFKTYEFCQYLNDMIENYDIVLLYNGYDTLGMIEEYEYHNWLIENGLDEDNLNNITFYDKGYDFFRYCMDSSIDEDKIVNLVKFMKKHNINDSREIKEEYWDEFMKEFEDEDVRELMEDSSDCIYIPELMDFLQPYQNITLTGGGISECLKEVEISLKSLDKKYEIDTDFTY